MNYVIFEDDGYKNLFPLSMLRPVFDIKSGVLTLKNRLLKLLPSKSALSMIVRKELKDIVSENNNNSVNKFSDSDSYFFNGRVVFDKLLVKKTLSLGKDSVLVSGNTVLSAHISGKELNKAEKLSGDFLSITFFKKFKIKEYDNSVNIISYPWDIIKDFEKNLIYELELFSKKKTGSCISKKAVISKSTAIDCRSGLVYVDDDAVIEPFCFIKGPVYIGKHVILKSGSRIYGPCSFGDNSKISGEISGTLFDECVNKQHDGFIGNTYACPFVNFGADTVTSNLKNNYSKVRVKHINGEFNTGMLFLGTIVGDHTKFGINTMLNTGTIAGIFANVAGGGFPDKKIDSFSWCILGKPPLKYRLEEALETAKIVMSRRNITMTDNYKKLVAFYYDL